MVKKTDKKILQYPLYLFLLPLFFVFHGYTENFGLITITDCLLLLATYYTALVIIYWLLYFFYRNNNKASLLSAYLFSFYFFFGAIHDFLKSYIIFASKFSVLLPAFFILFIYLLVYFKKTKQLFFKLTFFLNVLLVVYLLTDFVSVAWKMGHPNPDSLSTYGFKKNESYKPCTNCPNPDIYFLLFDEYSSTSDLKQTFNYNNSGLDSFLAGKGFSNQSASHSNYNFTPFSMASILNMNYLHGIKDVNEITIEDYASCNNLIRNNQVIQFLSSRYYDIVNYSIFDLAGHPALIEQPLLPVKARLITEQTLYNRFIHDVAWNFYMGPLEIKWLTQNVIYLNLNNNNQLLQLVKKESRTVSGRPRFIYAHFEMPHPPFYYDKNFKMRNKPDLISELMGVHSNSYTGYLPYVNGKIMELVDTIQKNTNHSAVVIIMGDHGYRAELKGISHDRFFKNLNAVYFPDKNYSLLNDSMSGVNQFRVIFNTLFKQSLPLLKDSTVFLTDAAPGK
jgi:hypothetical protein